MKLFDCFKTSKQFAEETKFVKIYKCVVDDKEYKIIITKKLANKYTIIHCVDDYVAWEQVPRIPRLAGKTYGDKVPLYKCERDKNITSIFVVRGKPNGFVGLDNGIFRCASNFDENYLNVMSYKRFKTL